MTLVSRVLDPGWGWRSKSMTPLKVRQIFSSGQKRNAAYNTNIVLGGLSPISRKRCVTV